MRHPEQYVGKNLIPPVPTPRGKQGFIYSPDFQILDPEAERVFFEQLAREPYNPVKSDRRNNQELRYQLQRYAKTPLDRESEKRLFAYYNFLRWQAATANGGEQMSELIQRVEGELMSRNINLLSVVVWEIANEMGFGKYETLLQIAEPMLLRAIRSFDYTTGNRFITYFAGDHEHIKMFIRGGERHARQHDTRAAILPVAVAAVMPVAGGIDRELPEYENLSDEFEESLTSSLSHEDRWLLRELVLDQERLETDIAEEQGVSRERIRQKKEVILNALFVVMLYHPDNFSDEAEAIGVSLIESEDDRQETAEALLEELITQANLSETEARAIRTYWKYGKNEAPDERAGFSTPKKYNTAAKAARWKLIRAARLGAHPGRYRRVVLHIKPG